MIRNRLAILMAERGLKITRVAKDTGISRNTITSTSQNDGEMIRLETINTLCKYLSITPCEFFEYEPVDLSFSAYAKIDFRFDKGPNKIEFNEFSVDLFMDVKGMQKSKTLELRCELTDKSEFGLIPFDPRVLDIMLFFEDIEEKNAFVNETFSGISPSFHRSIHDDIVNVLHVELKNKISQKYTEKVFEPYALDLFSEALEDFHVTIDSDVFKPF